MDSGHTAERPRFFGEHGPWDVNAAVPLEATRASTPVYPEGPMAQLPGDLWRVVAMYLQTSETMSLRCAAHVTDRHLSVVTNAILAGYALIDRMTQPENLRSSLSHIDIDQLMVLRLEARCHVIHRAAKRKGLGSFNPDGYPYIEKEQSLLALKTRYFKNQQPIRGSSHARSEQSWLSGIDATITALGAVALDFPNSIALSDVYAAQLYAPLLGVIRHPTAHVECMLATAAARLSIARWMDFLYALAPIKDICQPVAAAYAALTASIDCSYPMPRSTVLAVILHASLMSVNPQPIRKICVERIGMTPAFVAMEIAPLITALIAESVLFDADKNWVDVTRTLQMTTQRWDDVDGSFAACLHHAFVNALAKRTYGRGTQAWARLPEPVREALCTRELNIPLGKRKQYGLAGPTILAFWTLYFAIHNPKTVALPPDLWNRIDVLPWPLQAALWLLAAQQCEASLSDLMHAKGELWRDALSTPSSRQVDALLLKALTGGHAECAIPALQAILIWQLIGTEAAVGSRNRVQADERAIDSRRCLEFPLGASSVLNACTIMRRLPFVAALFARRDSAVKRGYDWIFEEFLSKEIVAFVCYPASHLICPSRAVMNVVLHYTPLCWTRLPEQVLTANAQPRAFAERMDIPLTDVLHAINWPQESRANLHPGRL